MKNLKKVLSLVLALAMALSLMTAAFAADAKDYADYGEVNYNEAVDVMTAIGVFDGMGGEFNPDGTLTREQAAKIITYMIMGKDEADKLVTTVAPYADVAADRWSAGAIAWCTNEGIISGMGNNRFAPTDNVTGLQFAKMLLVALGYDAEIQKLTGDSWAINTATLAINADLDKGMEEVSLSADLTREQACQMAFNTMKADTVEYDSRTSIDINGAQVTIGNNKAYAVTTTRDWGKNIYDEETATSKVYTVQFAEQYCRDLKLNEDATVVDDFGRPAHTWKYTNDKVGTYADEAVLTYTAGVKGTDLAADIDDAGYEIKKDAEIAYSRNGGTGSYSYAEITAALKSSDKIGGNGIVLELYANDQDEISKIVVIVSYLGEVTSVTKDKTSTRADERALKVEYGASKNVTLNADETAGFEEVYANAKVGDKLLIIPQYDNSRTVYALTASVPATVEGKITRANNADKVLTINGEVYEVAATGVQTYSAKDKTVTVYLDENGYVLDATEQGTSGDKSVAVLKVYKTLDEDGVLVDMIQGVTSDGETVNWKVDAGAYTPNKIYTYTEDDGEYTLGSVNASVADGNTLNPGVKTVTESDKTMMVSSTKAYYASDVKFIFVNDGKATVLDGVQKVNSKNVYVTLSQENAGDPVYITAVYVMGTASASTSTSDDLIFVVGSAMPGEASVVVDGKDKTFKVYTAYINGEEVDDFYTETSVTTSGFYSAEQDNDTGAYILSGNAYTTHEGNLAVTDEETVSNIVGNVLSTSSKDYDISGATIVDVTDNGYNITSGSEMKEFRDVKVMMIFNENDMTASYVYVTAYTAS